MPAKISRGSVRSVWRVSKRRSRGEFNWQRVKRCRLFTKVDTALSGLALVEPVGLGT